MYEVETDFGKIYVSYEAISSIVGATIKSTVGVNDVKPATVKQNFTTFLKKDANHTGVKTYMNKDDELNIDIHLRLIIGVNIPEFCKKLCESALLTLTSMIPDIQPKFNLYIASIE